jgi:hypothetical protein
MNSRTNSPVPSYKDEGFNLNPEISIADSGDDDQSSTGSVHNPGEVRLDSLSKLDQEMVDALLRMKEQVANEVSRAYSEGAIRPGIYNHEGTTYLVVPKGMIKEDDSLSGMIYDLAKIANIEIRMVNGEAKRTNIFNKKFIEGLWFGFFTNVNLKRRSDKKAYELGRTCSYALLIKNVFNKTDELGLGALAKDNYFFGNNPNQLSPKGNKVTFRIKSALRSFFEDPNLGDLILGFLNKVAESVGLSNLTENEQDKMIKDNLIPIDQIITSCYPTVTVGKGKKTSTKKRKPNPIRSSPLFNKKEMELISALTSPLFSELGFIVKDYESAVFEHGFKDLYDHIKSIINARWETLQRFANRTKIRLQDIRRITGNATVRKAGVSQENVHALLKQEPDMSKRLIKELKHIVGKHNIIVLVSQVFKVEPSSEEQAWLYLHAKAFDIYKSIDEKDIKISKAQAEPEVSDISSNFTHGLTLCAKLQNNFGELIKNYQLVRSTKFFKLFGRFRKIKELEESCSNLILESRKISGEALDMAVQVYLENLYTDFDAMVKTIRTKHIETSSKVLKDLTERSIVGATETVNKTVSLFIEDLNVIHNKWVALKV